jgi:hypothetical protein
MQMKDNPNNSPAQMPGVLQCSREVITMGRSKGQKIEGLEEKAEVRGWLF